MNIKHLFWWLAGADANILLRPECRTERMKHTNMGMIVLATSVMGGISGGYALLTIFGSPIVAVTLGTFWGCITINIDRSFLITSKSSTGFWAKAKMAVPRLMLASMLGLIISKPLELRMFQAEISQQLAQDRQTQSLEGQAITRLQDNRSKKAEEVNTARQQWQSDNKAAIDEATGEVGTGLRGTGDIYMLKRDTADQSLAALREREAELEQIDQKIAVQEAKLQALTQDILSGQASLLEQLGALSNLAANNATLALAIHTITLLFITLEITPVLVKLMSRPGPYDILLLAEQGQVEKSSELEVLEAQEEREEAFLLRRQLREGQSNKTLTLIREVIDTEFSEAMQKMLLRPEYARAFNQVMDVLQQNVVTTLAAEANRVNVYNATDVKKTLQKTHLDFAQQKAKQQVQQQWQEAKLDELRQMTRKMNEMEVKVFQDNLPTNDDETTPKAA
ncbi:DUF4407 domain-containing protein [Synechococcus sp. PCC 7335]|uniref:DUF4407 domain-containing protein n=1 Tax=Synechococcus sp. (strain ATCC 29403 / PCC 7335) TaxID=91464 RepID=UPI000571B58D|nr:DUF4407 domain-containing protein [Synechococcus sp. PCC 7335]